MINPNNFIYVDFTILAYMILENLVNQHLVSSSRILHAKAHLFVHKDFSICNESCLSDILDIHENLMISFIEIQEIEYFIPYHSVYLLVDG